MTPISFFDLEVDPNSGKILDIGCIRGDEATFHKTSVPEFIDFIKDSEYLVGHNIIQHDLKYLEKFTGIPNFGLEKAIDTLLFSPLLFPQNPYHRLLKDDKLQTEERNNPLNDSKKSRDLFYDEVNAFHELPSRVQVIYFNLLFPRSSFKCFFKQLRFQELYDADKLENIIRDEFTDKICAHSDIKAFIQQYPIDLAYALALIGCNDRNSITPPWVLKNYPNVERLLFLMKNSPCISGCNYCKKALDPIPALKRFFGFDNFRSYGDEPLQEKAVKAAVNNKSLLAIFPTGGGKSITFQIPALMSGENAKALTVVISPLQSLMKDQVDNLEKKEITEAVAINGLLDPIERSRAIERIENGGASLLYISPESLRSITIERLLLKRKIARFVIDEAHCFSSWGQDFRVDYLYIGDFIKNLQEKKNAEFAIPVSCFTATAKQKVIEDICAYFKEKLNIDLEVLKTNTSRKNLHYQVFQKGTDEEKYTQLRSIIESKDCPAIVYVSRTKRAYKLAERLTEDGYIAKPYHGKMDKEEKTANQSAFMNGEFKIMVATSAFGMGVDKEDVGAVIHYDISDSLENYIQEAGRAGRNENIEAECYILFNEEDLDKHFILLNQTKISINEINQVWKAIKDLTRSRNKVSNSALEIARKAGWDDGIKEIESRVTTAIAALEDAGYVKRGQNMPRIFANSILSKNAQDAIQTIKASNKFSDEQKIKAARIIKKLFSSKSKRLSTEEEAESRVDYISDQLGIIKEDVIRIIELLREENILAQSKDLTAFIKQYESTNRPLSVLESYGKQELFLLNHLQEGECSYHLKEINEGIIESGINDSNPDKIKSILNFWAIKNWIKRHSLDYSRHHIKVSLTIAKNEFLEKLNKRHFLARLIIEHLYKKASEIRSVTNLTEEILIEFSVLELKEMAEKSQGMFVMKFSIDDVEDSLFYLSRIEAIKFEGGFLVVYNRLSIDRLEKNNRIKYKESDYGKLHQFYEQKIQQIHIVGEYARKMIRNYNEALQFVDDYFGLNYSTFLRKYFPGSRQEEIMRPMTPEKFIQLFGALTPIQLKIINDQINQYIVVAAGPGSGKTRVLVHKLASLLLAEDVKHEQLLMLTFSRAAATEFKKRLIDLIGNAANFIEIKTFHSYCFDLLGRIGTLSQVDSVLNTTIDKIRKGEIEISRITKTVLVIDEAQDMNGNEYNLVRILMEQNEQMRVIFVGDDDQNIYAFRGSDSKYMRQFMEDKNAEMYELIENHRSKNNLVEFANAWVSHIQNRLKDQPGFAIQTENGNLQIIEYNQSNLIVPLVQVISQTNLTGSTSVLTKTNEEAAQIAGLLNTQGIRAKLIQTNDGFRLSHLYELRYYSDLLNLNENSPLISDEEWATARNALLTNFQKSAKLDLVVNILKQFEQVNPVRKYKSDWKAFLEESRIEDFINIDTETIYVSTIHKAKGKEFDNVFIMLKGLNPGNEEDKRSFYVGLTRAKSNLYVHYPDNFLNSISAEELTYQYNTNQYAEPNQITLTLTHRDVRLNYFEYVQHRMNTLQSGDSLSILEDGLGNSKRELVLKYSSGFKEILNKWIQSGFKVSRAYTNFLVYWKGQDDLKEVKIILPDLLLKRS